MLITAVSFLLTAPVILKRYSCKILYLPSKDYRTTWRWRLLLWALQQHYFLAELLPTYVLRSQLMQIRIAPAAFRSSLILPSFYSKPALFFKMSQLYTTATLLRPYRAPYRTSAPLTTLGASSPLVELQYISAVTFIRLFLL